MNALKLGGNLTGGNYLGKWEKECDLTGKRKKGKGMFQVRIQRTCWRGNATDGLTPSLGPIKSSPLDPTHLHSTHELSFKEMWRPSHQEDAITSHLYVSVTLHSGKTDSLPIHFDRRWSFRHYINEITEGVISVMVMIVTVSLNSMASLKW